MVLSRIKDGSGTNAFDEWEKRVGNPMEVRLQNDSGQTKCTLTIDLLAWRSSFFDFELIEMFKDVSDPIDGRIHEAGCLHSQNPDMVIQDVYTGSPAKAFYFRLCSRALVNIEDIARNQTNRLQTSNTRDLDWATHQMLRTQFESPWELVNVAFQYNASQVGGSVVKSRFSYLWQKGTNHQYYEAGENGYQDRTWRARSWHSEEEETVALSTALQ